MQLTDKRINYKVSEFILKIQVVDTSGQKFFKDSCSILNKKRLNDIFNILKKKYDISIPKGLIEETGWNLG